MRYATVFAGTEETRVRMFIDGLRTEIRIHVDHTQVATLTAACDAVASIECRQGGELYRAGSRLGQGDLLGEDVARRVRPSCWMCGDVGHTWAACPCGVRLLARLGPF